MEQSKNPLFAVYFILTKYTGDFYRKELLVSNSDGCLEKRRYLLLETTHLNEEANLYVLQILMKYQIYITT